MEGRQCLPIEEGKEVYIQYYTGQVHQYVIDMTVLGDILNHSEESNSKTEPRHL
jgi:hypothetical protein